MKTGILASALALCVSGCGEPDGDLLLGGSLTSGITAVTWKEFNEPTTIEASTMTVDGELRAYIDPTYTGEFELKVRNADGRWEFRPVSGIGYSRFHFTFQHDGVFYTIATKSGGVFLWESPDGLDWEEANGGLPILSGSPDPADPWHKMWNVAIAVDASGTAHLICECSDGSPGQSAVGLTYAAVPWNPDSMSFNGARSAEQAIPGGGNPDLKALPDGRLLAIYGKANRSDPAFGDAWHVTLAFRNPDGTWEERQDLLRIGATKGIHIADPHLTDLPEGSSLLTLSWDQLNSVGITLPVTVGEIGSM